MNDTIPGNLRVANDVWPTWSATTRVLRRRRHGRTFPAADGMHESCPPAACAAAMVPSPFGVHVALYVSVEFTARYQHRCPRTWSTRSRSS